MRYSLFFKGFFDILLSSFGLLLLSVPLLLIVLWIKSASNGPVFFIQKRLGLGGNVFTILKFRTMYHRRRESTEQIFPDHPEVTQTGKYLRRFKLDEIPQLINVLKGDMSTIGPRPCLPELQNTFDENGKARLKVRPGLFGLADIRGGYYLTWPQRWVYDRKYAENISFWLDLKLFFMAIPIILFDEDFFLKRKKES